MKDKHVLEAFSPINMTCDVLKVLKRWNVMWCNSKRKKISGQIWLEILCLSSVVIPIFITAHASLCYFCPVKIPLTAKRLEIPPSYTDPFEVLVSLMKKTTACSLCFSCLKASKHLQVTHQTTHHSFGLLSLHTRLNFSDTSERFACSRAWLLEMIL